MTSRPGSRKCLAARPPVVCTHSISPLVDTDLLRAVGPMLANRPCRCERKYRFSMSVNIDAGGELCVGVAFVARRNAMVENFC